MAMLKTMAGFGPGGAAPYDLRWYLTPELWLALIAGAGLLLVVQCQSGPRFDLKPYHALGEITAEETARLLGKRGSVAVIAEDFGKYNMA